MVKSKGLARNITLRLSEAALRRCKDLAFKEDKSVSQWLSDLIMRQVMNQYDFEVARKRAIKHLKEGLDLGGAPLTRDKAHER